MVFTTLFAALFAVTTAAELPPYRTTAVNEINRLPARAQFVPSETEELAIGIVQGTNNPEESRYVQKLSGTWDFKWKANPSNDWQKAAKIVVPGCWQMQGDYDPPLYSNQPYPIGFDGTGDPMVDPPKNYTSYKLRNPVGLYTTTFKRPWRWWFRRTVLRFNGVSSAFYVRVNGKLVGYGEDSRLPSEFDLTPYLKIFGANTLEVEVYKHSDGTYLEDQDFWRMSGIFRDVYLVSEAKRAPKDFIVETTISDDLKSATFVLRDEKGSELKRRELKDVKLWSPEFPYVYVTPFEYKHGWWIFGGTEHYAVSFGFRKVEIKDSVIYLNGKRVLFKGVNRHEMEPETGYAVTRRGMMRDIQIMKDYNVNAVRTCHYPNAPEWYDLTDRAGLMVVCEANVEAHGVPNFYGKNAAYLPQNPRFHDSIVERNARMVKFYRNHPSIVIWSLGNESGDGQAMVDAYKAIKAIDATRPVQYEGAQDSDHSDVKCPMYARPWDCEKYVANHPKKPFVLCEYTHAMGNSNGGAQKYWDLAEKYPSFQGGFVWDFVDQAIWKTDKRGKFLAYGGDFGDVPNDGNFNCNGLFDATRNPHPGVFELKHCYQSLHVKDFDFKTGSFTVENKNLFTPLDKFELSVVFRKGGEEIGVTPMGLPATNPGDTAKLKVDLPRETDAVLFRFENADGDFVAWDSFAKPFEPKKVDLAVTGVKNHPFKYNFYRAPTDNDRGWNMPNVCKVWAEATRDQKLPAGVKSDLKVGRTKDGNYLVNWNLTVPKGLPPIPRVGLTFTVPKTEETVTWYGLGPWENYVDRKSSAILGKYTLPLSGATSVRGLNPNNYIEPGEQGYRTNVRFLKVGAVEVEAITSPFGFNVWPYPQEMLIGKTHMRDVTAGDTLTINIDAAQMGVAGDNSWGARAHDEAMIGAGTYKLVFTVKGL